MTRLYEQLSLIWGEDFTAQVFDEAQKNFTDYRGGVSVDATLVTAIAKILRAGALQPCPKCKSIENVHCYSLTRNEGIDGTRD